MVKALGHRTREGTEGNQLSIFRPAFRGLFFKIAALTKRIVASVSANEESAVMSTIAGTLSALRVSPAVSGVKSPERREPVNEGVGVDAAARGYEVSLSSATASKASDVYKPPKASPGGMTFNYWSSGETTRFGSATGPTRLEYNVYRPDGFSIDGSTSPYTVTATGEPLTDDVIRRLDALVHGVTKQRIEIYRAGKDAGLSVPEIRERLVAFDCTLPDSYRNMVGSWYATDPQSRYLNPTHDEVMGGPRQLE